MNAAAEVQFFWAKVSKEDRDYYALLMKHFDAASGRRNEIVHAYVTGFTKDNIHQGYFLTPPHSSTKKNELPWVSFGKPEPTHPMKYRYTSADVKHYIERFVSLRQWLSSYAALIEAKYPHRRNDDRVE